MIRKKIFSKQILLFSFIMTLFSIFTVDFFKVPNPNVILLTVIVYLTFLGGYPSGSLSGFMVIVYSLYFFSLPNQFGSFSPENFKRVIVIILFIPVMVLIVGSLKRKYIVKTKELESLNEELKRIARIDALTDIPNRRYFDEVLIKEHERALREKIPLSLLMVDIDFFKSYNDAYGHIPGDNCLKMIAKVISEGVNRPGDFIARYGGEEFVVLLPNTDSKGALFVANKIINLISSLKITHCASQVCEYVTISIGAASTTNLKSHNQMYLLEMADKALYMAKGNGRNQVVLLPEVDELQE